MRTGILRNGFPVTFAGSRRPNDDDGYGGLYYHVLDPDHAVLTRWRYLMYLAEQMPVSMIRHIVPEHRKNLWCQLIC
jgi:hypothetical protein